MPTDSRSDDGGSQPAVPTASRSDDGGSQADVPSTSLTSESLVNAAAARSSSKRTAGWRPEDSCTINAGASCDNIAGASCATVSDKGPSEADGKASPGASTTGVCVTGPMGDAEASICSNPQSSSSDTARPTDWRFGSGRGRAGVGFGGGAPSVTTGTGIAPPSGGPELSSETGTGLPTAAEMRANRSAKLAVTAGAGRAGVARPYTGNSAGTDGADQPELPGAFPTNALG